MSIGRIILTLDAVYVRSPDAVAGVATYPRTNEETAPAGTRFVDVVVKVDDATRTYHQLGARFFGAPFVIADGRRIPLVSRAWVGVANDPSTFSETTEFAIPVNATSAILRLPLTAETSEVVSFRLW